MRRFRITFVPLILAVIALLAMVALVQDRNTRTWAVVMGLTTVAAVGYGAYQEHVATRAIGLARRRLGGTPFDDVRREMDRARRHERPFALVRVPLSTDTDASTAALLSALVRPASDRTGLRTVDRTWRIGNSLFLLLPETTADAARVAVSRVGAEDAIADGRWPVAAFPEDGLTIGALFEALGARPPRGEELSLPLVGEPGERPMRGAPVSISRDDR